MNFLLKILGILTVIGALIGAGYLIYNVYFSESAILSSPESQTQKIENGGESAGLIQKLSSAPATDFWVNNKDGLVYYVNEQGELKKITAQNNEIAVNNQILTSLNKIIPSPDGTKIIAVLDYPAKPIFAYYDTGTDAWERLPEGVIAADFDPTGKQIAYIKNIDAGALYTLDLNTKKSSEIMKYNAVEGDLNWIYKTDIHLSPKPTSQTGNDSIYFNINKKIAINTTSALDYATLFNKNDVLAIRFFTQPEPRLAVIYHLGSFLENIPFTTLPSKCVFNNKDLYCATPEVFPVKSTLPDDYLKSKFYTNDSIYRYNLDTRLSQKLTESLNMDIDKIIIRGNQLIIRNHQDQKLYQINIKTAE